MIGSLRMANNTMNHVKGIRLVRILNEDNSYVILTRVMYISEMRINLISLDTLELQGYTHSSENGIIKINEDGRVIL